MNRRLVLALLACSLAACFGHRRAAECYSTDDCDSDEVCFLASCQRAGYAITTVYATLTPPNDSPYLPQPYPGAIDLSRGSQRLLLRAPVTMNGQVVRAGAGAISMTGLLRARGDGPLPGMEVTQQVSVDGAGFALPLVPGTPYRLTFTPDGVAGEPPIDFPPAAEPELVLGADTTQNLTYPVADTLVVVRGQVTSDEWTPVSGAQVSAIATTLDGATSMRALSTSTDVAGEYRLVFAPGAERFDITVGSGTNPLVPESTAVGLLGTPSGSGTDLTLPKITLGDITGVQALTEVRDASSLVAIANASVLFVGSVGLGRFVTTGTSLTTGAIESDSAQLPTGVLTVLPGSYTITVAPPKSQPYALTTLDAELPSADEPLVLSVRRKVRVSGRVLRHERTPLPQARITMTLRGSAVARSFATTSSEDGSYALDVDPGTTDTPASYEVVVEPDRASGQPRHRELLRVTDVGESHDIELFAPSFAYGRVVSAASQVVPGVIIAFYSEELGTPTEPLLVGLGETNELGEFAVPLPTPDGN
ncbi:MAG: hypothetical protein AAB426_07480 [Myxococcota bacterium]